MSIVSYAQNFEDVMLWRALGHIKDGRYVDVGAQDPVVDSVSLAFYEAGWRGVHVEPTPFYANRLRDARPDETVIEAAVTSKSGPATIYEIPDTGLSTGDEAIAATHLKSGYANNALVVPSIRLAELLGLAQGDIHWLKIDVEGMEADVLRSWGKSAVRPWILVIEATYPNSQEPTHQLWIDQVLRRDYREVYFDGLSRFFVHSAHDALAASFQGSPNVFDGFGIAPVHWAAREVDRTYQERLSEASAQAAQQDSELRRRLDEVQAHATAMSEAANAALAERGQARDDALSAKIQLDAASRHHHESLAALAIESERLRTDAASATIGLVEAERAHREALIEHWREWQVSEANSHRASVEREDKLHSALREATAEAVSAQLSLTAVHATEIARLNADLLAITERSTVERLDRENALRREFQEELREVISRGDEERRLLREQSEERTAEAQATASRAESELARVQESVRRSDEEKRLLREQGEATIAEAQARASRTESELARLQEDVRRAGDERRALREQGEAKLADVEAAASKARAEVAGLLERVRLLIEEAEKTQAEVEWLRGGFSLATSERDEARAEVEWLRGGLAFANSQRDEARAEVEWLRGGLEHATGERDEARAEADYVRSAAEKANATAKAAVDAHLGRWHRFGEAIGLARPLRNPFGLKGWLLNLPPRPATMLHRLPHESELNMPSFAPQSGRDPYLAAHSLDELLSFDDVDFVCCAFVTLLGRQPDPDGAIVYLERLRCGFSKMTVARQIRQSPEGRRHDPGIAGLDRALRRHGNAIRPFTGWIWRTAGRGEGDTRRERQFRTLKNELKLVQQQLPAVGQLSSQLRSVLAALSKSEAEIEQIRSSQSGLREQLDHLLNRHRDAQAEVALVRASQDSLGDRLSSMLESVSKSNAEPVGLVTIEQILAAFGDQTDA